MPNGEADYNYQMPAQHNEGFPPNRASWDPSLKDGSWTTEPTEPPPPRKPDTQGPCRHGYQKENGGCQCLGDFRVAGPTDIFDYFQGSCNQYMCTSDELCVNVTQVPDAKCLVHKWNCYCGFKYAFDAYWSGKETDEPLNGGKCMGVLYTTSVYLTELSLHYCEYWWIRWLMAAAVLLPFGRKRTICDHHDPSLYNAIRHTCGFMADCDGGCVHRVDYNLDTLKDDFAWSLYILDIGLWSYVFLFTIWMVGMVCWSVLFIIFILTLIIGGLCCALCTLGAGDGGGDCCPNVGSSHGGCCDAAVGESSSQEMYSEIYYFSGGPVPSDPLWGTTGYGSCGWTSSSRDDDCCCPRDSRIICCRPFAWLIYWFPTVPENLWGGLFGLFLGTHRMTPECWQYIGGNCIIEFFGMGWLRRSDLHDNEAWRVQVSNFLWPQGPENRNNTSASSPSRTTNPLRAFTTMDVEEHPDGTRVRVGHAAAIIMNRPFQRSDRMPESNWQDYCNGKCWICRDENQLWDQWIQCHHTFCAGCSTEMLTRRMPCPLCRVGSTVVRRGKEYPPELRTLDRAVE